MAIWWFHSKMIDSGYSDSNSHTNKDDMYHLSIYRIAAYISFGEINTAKGMK